MTQERAAATALEAHPDSTREVSCSCAVHGSGSYDNAAADACRPALPTERGPLLAATRLADVWSMDFGSGALTSGRRLKCLTVAGDFSRECVNIGVDLSMRGSYVIRVLDQAARCRGDPRSVRTVGTERGPEFTARGFMSWAQVRGIEHLLIQPGRPMQNAFVERFNGRFRDARRNENWFVTLAQAREAVAVWRHDYNEVEPQGNIGRTPPAAFAAPAEPKVSFGRR